ncbi:hypothetical protein FKM82_026522 [Ascaphus truei]
MDSRFVKPANLSEATWSPCPAGIWSWSSSVSCVVSCNALKSGPESSCSGASICGASSTISSSSLLTFSCSVGDTSDSVSSAITI